MPTQINNAVATSALIDEFGVKGRYRLTLDGVVVPVAVVADVRPTQFQGATYQDHDTIAAVAGEVAAILVTGGELGDFPFTTVLHSLRVRPSGTAVVMQIRVDNTTAFVLTGATDYLGRNRLNGGRGASPVVAVNGTIAAAAGTIVETVACAADVDTIIDLSGWQFPPGTPTAGQFPRIGIFSDTANVGVNTSLVWSILGGSGS